MRRSPRTLREHVDQQRAYRANGDADGQSNDLPAPVAVTDEGESPMQLPHHVRRWLEYNGMRLYNPTTMRIQRYRYRGSQIPTPWAINVVPA
jgi:hypothetical protein